MKWKFTREELVEAGVEEEDIIQLVLSNAGNKPLIATDVYNDVLYGDGKTDGECPSCGNYIYIDHSEWYGDWSRIWRLNDDYSVFPCNECKSLIFLTWREWDED